MRIGRGLIVLLIVAFSATSAMAGGFRLPEAGAKAMSMGFAFTAQADDPSAIYFNPAGIMQLEGVNVMAGGTYVDGKGATFTGTTPLTGGLSVAETQKDLIFLIPNAYFTQKVSSKFAYGVGIFAPFGLGQEYQDRTTSIFRNQITKIDLMTLVVNPTVAYKVNDSLSIGGGIDYMFARAKLAKTAVVSLPSFVNIYQLDLDGEGSAWGFNLGALYTPSKDWKVGLSYRSPFKVKIHEGDVKIHDIENTVAFVAPGLTTAQVFGIFGGAANKGTTTLNLPPTAGLGVAYTCNKLTIEADADFTFWRNFRSLDIIIKDKTNPLIKDSLTAENWRDTLAFYLGGEYRISDPWALRAGFRYDPTPVPPSTMNPSLPDATKLYYSLGAGYKFKNWTFDLAYMFVDKRDRTANNQTANAPPTVGTGFNGKWSGNSQLVALDIGFKF